MVLTAACLNSNQYISSQIAQCLSNLLAAQFRKLFVDVYWDPSRLEWSLCPVQLQESPSTSNSTTLSPSPTPANASSIAPATGTQNSTSTTFSLQSATTNGTVVARQTTTFPFTSALSSPLTTPTTTRGSTHNATAQTVDDTSVQVGPYNCSNSATLDLILDVLDGRFVVTNTDLNATMVELTLNIHAAASASNPTGSPPQPPAEDLPANTNLLSQVLTNSVGNWIYGPSSLRTQRQNFNIPGGWYEVDANDRPDNSYFKVELTDGKYSSPDGWPGENYIELLNYKRLIVGFGTVDPQMQQYNFEADANVIFPQNYITTKQTVVTASNGQVTNGCIFNPDTTSLARVNSSWAYSSLPGNSSITADNIPILTTQAYSVTDCGISPILNATLDGTTADANYQPYREYAISSIWSWAQGQPGNASMEENEGSDRCATLNSTSGHWQTSNCQLSYPGACRADHEPYVWQIASDANNYAGIDQACPNGTSFEVPRTALENAYLVAAFRQYRYDLFALQPGAATDSVNGAGLVWLNLNDLDVPTCWVRGSNTSCPYRNSPETKDSRIVVPIIAGLIIFALTALMILVKCAGNRQNSKRRRRRGSDGWDYEGVPA